MALTLTPDELHEQRRNWFELLFYGVALPRFRHGHMGEGYAATYRKKVIDAIRHILRRVQRENVIRQACLRLRRTPCSYHEKVDTRLSLLEQSRSVHLLASEKPDPSSGIPCPFQRND
jgi:uncharacterized protein YjiS (DUF1127 family)